MKFIIAFLFPLLGCLIAALVETKQASITKKVLLTPENNHLKSTDSSILNRTDNFHTLKVIKQISRSVNMSNREIYDDENKSHKILSCSLECDCDTKEYIFLSDWQGNVTIIEANTYKVIRNDQRPEISNSTLAITDGVLYNIDTLNGKILSTDVRNMISGAVANWDHVGSFPEEHQKEIRNSAVVHCSNIYFVTYSGLLYKYDIILRTVTQKGVIEPSNRYLSLVVVNDIIYIYTHAHFFSFDGSVVKELPQTEFKFSPGLFKLGNTICAVGELAEEVGLTPVNCYDPKNQEWSISSYINTGRTYAAIARTQLGTCVFAGESNSFWIYSAEIFNYETREWTYIPSPFTTSAVYLQAITFSS